MNRKITGVRDAFSLSKEDLVGLTSVLSDPSSRRRASITRAKYKRGRSDVDVINISLYRSDDQIGWVTLTRRLSASASEPKVSAEIFSPYDGAAGERAVLIMESALERFMASASGLLSQRREEHAQVLHDIDALLRAHQNRISGPEMSFPSQAARKQALDAFLGDPPTQFCGFDVVVNGTASEVGALLCVRDLPVSGLRVPYSEDAPIIRVNPEIGLSGVSTLIMEALTEKLASSIFSEAQPHEPGPER